MMLLDGKNCFMRKVNNPVLAPMSKTTGSDRFDHHIRTTINEDLLVYV